MTVNHFVHHVPCYTIQKNHYRSAGSPLWLVLRKISVVAPALHNLIQCGSKLLQGCRKGSLYCSDEVTAAAQWSHKSEEICYGPVLRVQLYNVTRLFTYVQQCNCVLRFHSRYLTLQYSMFYSINSYTYFTAKSQEIIRYKMAWYKKLLHFNLNV